MKLDFERTIKKMDQALNDYQIGYIVGSIASGLTIRKIKKTIMNRSDLTKWDKTAIYNFCDDLIKKDNQNKRRGK